MDSTKQTSELHMDYAEPLIKAKQALKDYEQAVLHGEYFAALSMVRTIRESCGTLYDFAQSRFVERLANDSKP